MSGSFSITSEPVWKRTRISVPREDGTFLTMPPLSAAPKLLHEQRELFALPELLLFGRPLADVRKAARAEVLRSALQYTGEILGSNARLPGIEQLAAVPLIVTGHQPEIFHPGVWVKQIATSLLAQRASGVGLNLIVDNDICDSTSISVPAGTREAPTKMEIAFDKPRADQPWEEAKILDPLLFGSFADRVREAWTWQNGPPLLSDFWRHVLNKSLQSNHLVDCLTAGRANFEWQNGWGNLELPLSRVCETDAFREFVTHLISDASHFRDTHNAAVAEYRRINRVRSRAHPVPDLEAVGSWHETPFWIWQQGTRARGRLFVQQHGGELLLAAHPTDQAIVGKIPLSSADHSAAVAALRELSQRGWKLRTRALTTTLFARLLLGDLFIHGIGGAKYDEITDRLISRWLKLPAPAYLTLSATAWLPFSQPFPDTGQDAERLRQRIRDMEQNPQRHLTGTDRQAIESLVERRNSLLAEAQSVRTESASVAATRSVSRRLGYARHQELRAIRKQLAQQTTIQRAALQDELTAVEQRLAANRLLKSREFSFCLYPLDRVHRMVAELEQLIVEPPRS